MATIAELRELADRENVDLAGLTRKEDIVNALRSADVEVPDEQSDAQADQAEAIAEAQEDADNPEPGEPQVRPNPVEHPGKLRGEAPTGQVPDVSNLPDPTVVEYGAESEPKTGKDAVKAVEEAEASQVAATEAQDKAFADNPPRHVAATKTTNIQTPTGMVQRVDELAEEKPTEAGYETRPVGEG